MSIKFINKTLYDKRLAKNIDLKQASSLLHISKLHLKLIEKGYWRVSKKLQPRFIKLYNLDSSFFTTNSDLPINIDKYKPIDNDHKIRKFISKKWVRWTSLGLVVANAGVIAYGSYCLDKKQINPTSKWTKEFHTFHNRMQEVGTEKISVLYPGDTKYVVSDDAGKIYDDGTSYCSVQTYGNKSHASDTSIDSTFEVSQDSKEYKEVKSGSSFEFNILVYNKKKIVYSSFTSPFLSSGIKIAYATGVLSDDGYLEYKPFNYTVNGETKTAKVGSEVYKTFSSAFNYYRLKSFININDVLRKNKLGYDYVDDLVHDIRTICKDNVLHFRLGNWLTILASIFGVAFIFLFSLSFYWYYRHKKRIKQARVLSQRQYIEQFAANPNVKIKKDLKLRLVIPEFVLKIIGFLIAALSSIAIIMIVLAVFKGTIWDFLDTLRVNNFTNNFLIAGVLLSFFISLDNYSKRHSNELVVNIFTFLFIGIAFYVAESTLYYSLSTRGNIYSMLFGYLDNILPGNFFWPLGLYCLLFLFLFTTPNRLRGNKNKIQTFRLMAIIPTVILIFNLFYTYLIKNNVNAPYYVNFLFFSKGTVLIVFLLLYIYGLFIYRSKLNKKYGVAFCDNIYYDSTRYNFVKNSIASSILVGILAFDLIFRFALPNNQFKLGNNWAIGLIIPLILFYRPHIGNRNKIWDRSCTFFLNPLASFGGYIGAVLIIFTQLGMNEIFFLLW